MSTSSSTRPAAASGTFQIGDRTVNRLGYGTMQLPGDGVWGPTRDHDESVRVLRRALELGITLIDTADSYGPHVADDLVREALHPYPPELVIATKAGLTRSGPGRWGQDGRPEHLRASCEDSLTRLGLETIELFQLHRIDSKVPADEQFGTLKELQDEGKIQHAGLSEVSIDEIEAARKVLPIVTVQNQYNLVDRQSEDVLDVLRARGHRLHPVVPDRERQARRRGWCGGRARGREGRDARPDRARLAARALARDAADPRDVEGGTPRGELRGCARAADAVRARQPDREPVTAVPRAVRGRVATARARAASACRRLAFHRALPGYAPHHARRRAAGSRRRSASTRSGSRTSPAASGCRRSSSSARHGRSRSCSAAGRTSQGSRRRARELGIDRLTTATDGNHGRAVARMAALVGLRATIYVPDAMRPARREAIVSEGADLVVVRRGLRRGRAAVAGGRRRRSGVPCGERRRPRRLEPRRRLGHRRLLDALRRDRRAAAPGGLARRRPAADRRRRVRLRRCALGAVARGGRDRRRPGRRAVHRRLARSRAGRSRSRRPARRWRVSTRERPPRPRGRRSRRVSRVRS